MQARDRLVRHVGLAIFARRPTSSKILRDPQWAVCSNDIGRAPIDQTRVPSGRLRETLCDVEREIRERCGASIGSGGRG